MLPHYNILEICYEKDVTYRGDEVAKVHSAATWEICSSHCRANPECLVWVYFTESYDKEKQRKECNLKSSDEGQISEAGLISGDRNCGKPSSK